MPLTYFRYTGAGFQPANRSFRGWSAVRLTHVPLLVAAALFCLGLNLFAQTLDSQRTEGANKSWRAFTDLESANVTPVRIIESHSQYGNRTLDKRSVQIPGYAGHFEFYEDIETETLQVDANTVRITTRTFARDGNDRKTVIKVIEESKHTRPGGDSNSIRITSSSDLNGQLQPVRREIVETRRIGMDIEQTNSTVMLPSINGGFAPAIQTRELRKRGANHTLESEKSTLLRDGSGNWQLSELRRASITGEGKNRSTEERVSGRDAEGKLTEVSRVLSAESESSSGEKQSVLDRYSLDVPGATRDGGLHLVERTTWMLRTSTAGEQISEERVQQANPGDPNSGLRISTLTNDTVRPGSAPGCRPPGTFELVTRTGVLE